MQCYIVVDFVVVLCWWPSNLWSFGVCVHEALDTVRFPVCIQLLFHYGFCLLWASFFVGLSLVVISSSLCFPGFQGLVCIFADSFGFLFYFDNGCILFCLPLFISVITFTCAPQLFLLPSLCPGPVSSQLPAVCLSVWAQLVLPSWFATGPVWLCLQYVPLIKLCFWGYFCVWRPALGSPSCLLRLVMSDLSMIHCYFSLLIYL